MNAAEHYQAGHLAEAITAATASVKAKPQDLSVRGFLAELLCFAGDLERADKQLDALGQLDPQVLMGVALFRQLIRAEQARQQFFSEGRLPEFIDKPSAELQLRLAASVQLRAGAHDKAAELFARAEEARTPVRGACDGKPFDDIRDLDDLTASICEVMTSTGKYYWIAWSQIDSLDLHSPQRPRDLLWRPAHMVVQGGPDGEVFVPVLYPGTASATNDALRLGRATEWLGEDGPIVRGIGQRTLLVGDRDLSILELSNIETHAQTATT